MSCLSPEQVEIGPCEAWSTAPRTLGGNNEHQCVRSDPWRDWVMLALGAWLFPSPCILRFAIGAPTAGAEEAPGPTTAAWNAWILGVVIAALALWATLKFAEWHDWANGVLGVWLVVSPLDARVCGAHERSLEPPDRRPADRSAGGLGALGHAAPAFAAHRVSGASQSAGRLSGRPLPGPRFSVDRHRIGNSAASA
jgi:SPW repeat